MIKLEYIEIKNFRSYSNKPTIFKFNSDVLTIINGVNGSGKTTILYALLYVLYGKVHKIKLEDMMNDRASSNMTITLHFQFKEDSYKIIRGLKPKLFEIYKNGNLLAINSIKDQQTYLEENILGISYNLFLKLIMINSSIFSKNFVTLSASERRDFLEEILSLDMLSTITKYIKDGIKESKTLLVDSEYQITNLNNSIENENRNIVEYKSFLDQESNKVSKSTILKLELEISKFKKHDIKAIQLSNNSYLKLKSNLDTLENSLKGVNVSKDLPLDITKLEKIQEQLLKDISYGRENKPKLELLDKSIKDLKDKLVREDLEFKELTKSYSKKDFTKAEEDLVKVSKRLKWFLDSHKDLKELNKTIDILKLSLTNDNKSLIEIEHRKSFIKQYSVCEGCNKLSSITNLLKEGQLLSDFTDDVTREETLLRKTIKINEDKLTKATNSESELVNKLSLEPSFKLKELELKDTIDKLNKIKSNLELLKNSKTINQTLLKALEEDYSKFNIKLIKSYDLIRDTFLENKQKLISLKEISSNQKQYNSIKKDLTKLRYQDIDKFISENKAIELKELELKNMNKIFNDVTQFKARLKKCQTNIKDFTLSKKALDLKTKELSQKNLSYLRIKDVCENEAVKERIFSQYVPLFNKQVNRYFEEFNIPFKLELDKLFNFNFIKRGRSVSYSTFSKGEEVRINLAIILSFVKIIELRNLFKINLLAFDEVDGVLDSENLNSVIELLSQLKDRKIIFITHRTDLNIDERYNYELLEVEKPSNGFTKLTKL